jgi:hypothetical protein
MQQVIISIRKTGISSKIDRKFFSGMTLLISSVDNDLMNPKLFSFEKLFEFSRLSDGKPI